MPKSVLKDDIHLPQKLPCVSISTYCLFYVFIYTMPIKDSAFIVGSISLFIFAARLNIAGFY